MRLLPFSTTVRLSIATLMGASIPIASTRPASSARVEECLAEGYDMCEHDWDEDDEENEFVGTFEELIATNGHFPKKGEKLLKAGAQSAKTPVKAKTAPAPASAAKASAKTKTAQALAPRKTGAKSGVAALPSTVRADPESRKQSVKSSTTSNAGRASKAKKTSNSRTSLPKVEQTASVKASVAPPRPPQRRRAMPGACSDDSSDDRRMPGVEDY